MKQWIWPIFLFLLCVIAALTVPYWLVPTLKFIGANSDLIQATADLLQIIIWCVAGIIAIITLLKRAKTHRQATATGAKADSSQQSVSNFFPSEAIANAIRYYVPPDISTDNPSHDEKGIDKLSREPLFETIDKFLAVDSPFHHLYVFGDSGTGKTAFVLNYYARNYQLPEQKQQKIAIIPLGLPNAERYIDDIKNQEETAIFLDAFDEDTAAIKNPEQRFARLLKRCRNFRRVVITSRSQFFLSDKAIQHETGMERLDDRPAGQPSQWKFDTRHLLPLRDAQVKAYLRKRYFWPFGARRRAFQLVKQAPTLAIRPMLLTYIPDLVKRNITFSYTFQLYETMVEAWIVREKYIDPEALRKFSEHLAIDLYSNREKRRAEWIDHDELAPLARDWQISLKKWQMTSRSLLNRADAAGHYKFAHRSIMEYLFVKRLIDGDDRCRKLQRTDQMNTFLMEMLKSRGNRFTIPKHQDLGRYPLQLRSTAVENLQPADVGSMIKGLGYFDTNKHKQGQGLVHLYDTIEKDGVKLVNDYATGLTWQQGGTDQQPTFADAEKHIQKLNREKFAGYNDWRLPTLEEAMSLMEPEKKNGGLYIDPVFDAKQTWIWTADKQSAGVAWYVSFYLGGCVSHVSNYGYLGLVRAVRSGQS